MHRRDIEMIDAEAPPDEILSQAINSPHTRIPIFRGEPENIVGVIHAKDLSRAVHRFVRANAGGEGALEGFDIMDVGRRVGTLFITLFPLFMLVLNVTVIGVIWFGAIEIDAGRAQVGTLFAFMMYVGIILSGGNVDIAAFSAMVTGT